MPSQSYRELKSSIRELRCHLLPARFDKNGLYRSRVFTGVIAFRVLSHAAIEDYIETRVAEIAIKAASHCSLTKKISEPAAHIASFTEKSYGVPPDTFNPPQKNQAKDWPERVDLVARVVGAASVFVNFVKRENHGIREKNLMRLLLSVGLRYSDIDPVLVAELDSFGEKRGEVAHSSTAKHARKNPNPEDELSRVNQLVALIKDLDDKLDRVLHSI